MRATGGGPRSIERREAIQWARAPRILMGRGLALFASVALVGLLAFLTVAVLLEDGLNVIVVFSLVILAVLGFGVLGAMTSADEDD